MKISCFFLFFSIIINSLSAQLFDTKEGFTHADSLRGSNTEFRNFWDVQKYIITVQPDFKKKSIQGKTAIYFTINENYNGNATLQIDLQKPLNIQSIRFADNKEHPYENFVLKKDRYKREGNIYWVNLSAYSLKPENEYSIEIEYSGLPKEAENAPWDGGWVFTKDKKGRPWMSVACQGLGASVWYPCKDYQGDEPDKGAILNILTPKDLVGVGNGRLITLDKNNPNYDWYSWQVVNPINNYNIVPNIGHYVNFTDTYEGEKGTLDLSYWVMDYNEKKAKEHFKVVKPMLEAFEYWMGPYPFYEDSYKLIETPYLGMEHQSGIAYGNGYVNGYLNGDLSGTGVGKNWDYIIVHESGHEWFGNNITTQDIADMWVQEGFTSYSETLFTDHFMDLSSSLKYNYGTRRGIQNDRPIIGQYGVNSEGSGDMYHKAANMIHTIRVLMEDDQKFRAMLRDMNATFYHQTVTGQQIEDYISNYTGKDLHAFFNQYLRTTQIPIIRFRKNKGDIEYRYENIVANFDMPLLLIEDGKWIFPSAEWQKLEGYSKIPTVNPNLLIIQK